MKRLAIVVAALASFPAHAQLVSPLNAGDTSALATKAELAAVQSQMPLPSTTVPPAEQVAPTVGTSMRYRRMDDVQPRITRATKCTLVAGGTCSVTYAAIPSTDPNVIAFAVNAGSQPIICGPSADATATTATIKCFITQPTTLPALATSLLGLLIPITVTAPAGTVVQVTILPKT